MVCRVASYRVGSVGSDPFESGQIELDRVTSTHVESSRHVELGRVWYGRVRSGRVRLDRLVELGRLGSVGLGPLAQYKFFCNVVFILTHYGKASPTWQQLYQQRLFELHCRA